MSASRRKYSIHLFGSGVAPIGNEHAAIRKPDQLNPSSAADLPEVIDFMEPPAGVEPATC